MKRNKKAGLIIVIISFLLQVITLPTSPGIFYEPSHYYNLYLPNFGFNSEISILPTSFKTLAAEYSFKKVSLLLFQNDALALYRSLYLLSPILIFLAFILFFSMIPAFRKERVLLSSLLALTVDWPSIPLILGITAVYCIIKSMSKKNTSFKIVLILSFTSLALYWHSAHILFLMPIVFILIFIIIFNKKEYLYQQKLREVLNILSIILIISIITWVLIRETPLFSMAFKITYYLDFSVITKALFSKGSFLPVEYQYIFNFYIPSTYIDLIRYTAYLLTISIFLLYVLHDIYAKKYNKIFILALSFISGSIGFILLYYIATETIGPAPMFIFLIPFLLALCVNSIKKQSKRSKIGWGFIFIIIITFLIIIKSYNIYEYVTTSVGFSNDFERYSSSSLWITKNLPAGTRIISDANTIGYMAICYGKTNQFEHNTVYFSSIGLNIYDQLYKGIYQSDSKVIYNFDIYKKNLVFQSLEAWNKFKPLSPDIIQRNIFNIFYNNYGILLLSKQ